ncbi:MAG: SDR family NAD(P)-dependent oxidoreductase, partial [Pseudomonadota bacterium]
MRISETAAVITGGASGLGEATARHFREMGVQVTIFDRDKDRGALVADE